MDCGAFSDLFEYFWVVLADKGYQNAREIVGMIHAKKNPRGCELTPADEKENKLVSSDRIVVVIIFGRKRKTRSIMFTKFMWSEKGNGLSSDTTKVGNAA